MSRLKVLMLAPNCDSSDVGEAYCAYQWARALGRQVDATLLTLQRNRRECVANQLPGVNVVTLPEPSWAARHERINAMLKPAYPIFYKWARSWIKQELRAGRSFELGHQFTPLALRYPSPFSGLGLPYVLGPLGGSINTPSAFEAECASSAWFTKLRRLDRLRLKRDPILRRTYSNAGTVLGVAPYVEEVLKDVTIQNFAVMSELGIDEVAARKPYKKPPNGHLRLLHVGRGVRTKGLRDIVRALALLPELPDVTLDSAGCGDEIEDCKKHSRDLCVDHRIRFHGQIPRRDVEALYENADLFTFPSFREPSGSVIFEAMRWGLPVITTNLGGPGHVINDSCGVRLPATCPKQLAQDLAETISNFAKRPEQLSKLRVGALRRVEDLGQWQNKADTVVNLYHELLTRQENRTAQ